MLRTGIVGSGQAATHYARCHEQLATTELVGAVPSVVGGESGPAERDDVPRFQSLTTLFEQTHVDLVDVCDPDLPRDRLIEGVASEDVDVLVPHPFELDTPGLRDLAAEIVVGGGRLLIKQPYRHHPGLRKIRTEIQEDGIGSVGVTRLSHRLPYQERHERMAASSILTNPGAIYFDTLHWLLGEIEQVYARRSEVGQASEEVSNALLRFASGGTAHLELALLSHVEEREFLDLRGTEGGIEFDLAADHGLSFVTTNQAAMTTDTSVMGPPELSTDASYRELDRIVAFLRSEADEPPEDVLTATDAEASLDAVGAALRSAEDNMPVPTEEIPA